MVHKFGKRKDILHTHTLVKHKTQNKKIHNTNVDQSKRKRKKEDVLVLLFFLKISHHSSVTGIVCCDKDDDPDEYDVDVESF